MGTPAVIMTAMIIGLIVGLTAEYIERCRSKGRTVRMTHSHDHRRPVQDTLSGLFAVDPGTLSRASDPDTSHRAAMLIQPESARARVLRMFQARHPDPWVDIRGNPAYRQRYGGAEGTFRKRRSDLVHLGLVTDSEQRATVQGHSHIVWVLTPAGMAWGRG